MIPINFPESNVEMRGDHIEIDGHKVGNLRVWCGDDKEKYISCWRPSFTERVKLLFTGKLWCTFHQSTFPPTSIEVENPFFRKDMTF